MKQRKLNHPYSGKYTNQPILEGFKMKKKLILFLKYGIHYVGIIMFSIIIAIIKGLFAFFRDIIFYYDDDVRHAINHTREEYKKEKEKL